MAKYGFVSQSVSDAIKAMEDYCGMSVKQIPLPFVSPNSKYFITQNGIVFGCTKRGSYYNWTKRYIGSRKRGRCFLACKGSNKHEVVYLIYALYYTYKLKEYIPKLMLKPINGDSNDLDLSNWVVDENHIPAYYTDNVNNYQNLYAKYYQRLVRTIHFLCYPGISTTDAEDIVSDSYLEMCKNQKIVSEIAYYLWLTIAKREAIKVQHKKSLNVDFFFENGEEKYTFSSPAIVEMNLIQKVSGERRKEYVTAWLKGDDMTKIAKDYHVSYFSVHDGVFKAIKQLQKECSSDIKIIKGF